ncbi:Alpha/beta-Hydrolases superfamily protein isoform 3 [Capsicum annuum]|nr:Alpha/beta-Hydrolases superfamily protein isoform 3 [Capsicum annuum]
MVRLRRFARLTDKMVAAIPPSQPDSLYRAPNDSKTLYCFLASCCYIFFIVSFSVPGFAAVESRVFPKQPLYLKEVVLRCERTESFQAQCVMTTMEAYGVKKMIVVGLSYGGFVGYSMASQYPEAVEKLVLGCSGVCLEEKDMKNGMFQVKSVDEAVSILLVKFSFYKPAKHVPSCFLNDFIYIFSDGVWFEGNSGFLSQSSVFLVLVRGKSYVVRKWIRSSLERKKGLGRIDLVLGILGGSWVNGFLKGFERSFIRFGGLICSHGCSRIT